MNLSVDKAKKMLVGWEIILEYNKNHENKITYEQFIEAFYQTLKEKKEFCVNCIVCHKCNG